MSELFESIAIELPTIWIKGAAWSIAAVLVVFLFRFFQVPAAGLRLFWNGNVSALLLIAVVEWVAPEWVAPEWRIDVSPADSNHPLYEWTTPLLPGASPAKEVSESTTVATEASKADPTSASFPVTPIILIGMIWALGAFAFLVVFARNLFRLGRYWKSANDISAAQAAEIDTLLHQIGIPGLGASVKYSDQITVPMAWGILRNKILLPTAIWHSDPDDFRRILIHELNHLESRDPFWSFLSQIALLIHWPNLLVWHAARQLRLSQEKSCDDRVLSETPYGGESEQYAGLLVSIAKFSTRSAVNRNDTIAFSITGRSSTLSRRIDSILNENMKRTRPNRIQVISTFGLQLCLAGFLGLTIIGDSLTAAERKETEALKKRISELENQVAQLQSDTEEVVEQSKIDEIVEENRQKARERMREDLGEYSQEELREIETLYQVANKNWRSEEARMSLEKLVDEYDDANRTGCALLYLAQYSEGDKREEYLRRVVEDFSDCYYGNGCQVGGYGRYLLAAFLKDKGETDEAAEVIEEIEKDYATATSHSRKLIVEMVQSLK